MKILVTGASGLIGKNFIRQALRLGHEVRALVRNTETIRMLPKGRIFKWRHDLAPPEEAFEGVDSIVHLAGENVADKPWSEDRKKRITDSRLLGTKNLISALSRLPAGERPKTLFSASAVGIYGYHQSGALNEASACGDDFLAKLCVDWEQEAMKADSLGIRVILARTGIVLSREGGALVKMPPVRISSGENWMSWIHIEDMVRIIMFALTEESVKGEINCVAPNPVQNKSFVRALAKAKGVFTFGFVPRPILKAMLGEMSAVILSNLRVYPNNLLNYGFEFKYPHLEPALTKEIGESHILDRHVYRDQFVALQPEEVFPFFSRAENLEALTPPWLNFKIVSKSSEAIDSGSLIDYKLKIHGVPVRWRTEIKDWNQNESFVDEQLRGPYSKWRHRHTFHRVLGGCLLSDEIAYRVPGSFLGNLFLGNWIAGDIHQIFNYRQIRIHELFQSGQLKERS